MPHGKLRRVYENEYHETPASISHWALETFGPTGSNLSCAARANKEMSELLSLLAKDDNDPKLGEELADVVIVLWRLAVRANVNLEVEIDTKMAKNRLRKWRSTGDGHGQHIPEENLLEEQAKPRNAPGPSLQYPEYPEF